MKKKLFLFLFLLLGLSLSAQRNLSQSSRYSKETFVYRLDNKQLADLIKKGLKEDYYGFDSLDDSYLTQLVTTYSNSGKSPDLPPGTYVYVSAYNGEIKYSLRNEIPFEPIMLELEKEMQLILQENASGNLITSANVFLNNKKIKFDKHSRTYHASNGKEESMLRINYQGNDYYYRIDFEIDDDDTEKDFEYYKNKISTSFNKKIRVPIRRAFHSKSKDSYYFSSQYTGYVAYDKPKYRPGDTVNVKAWITDKKANPIKDKELLVRIDGGNNPLGIARSYRKGGFTFSFVLVDSLDLRLDKSYGVSFEKVPAPDKLQLANEDYTQRRIFIGEYFKYEDYELKDVKFTSRIEPTFYRGDEIALYAKAYDENGMTVPDGRVKIVMLSEKFYGVRPAMEFLPDTMWTHEQRLDPEGETKIVIPDSVFPKANVGCDLDIVFLNSDNQRLQDSHDFNYIDHDFYVKKQIVGDSILLTAIKAGKICEEPAQILVRKSNDSEYTMERQLPLKLKTEPDVTAYYIQIGEDAETVYTEKLISFPGSKVYRTADSLFVTINNPTRVPFWYTVYVGNKPEIRSQSEGDVYLAKKLSTDKEVTVRWQYLFDGEMETRTASAGISKKRLNIQVKAPEYVTPGQTFDVEAVVTDMKEIPQEDVDLTAYAPTSKFNSRQSVFVPYFGKNVKSKPIEISKYEVNESIKNGTLYNWEKWYKDLKLDDIEYYQFLYPTTAYFTSEETDGKTTIAPFVVNGGKVEPIHAIYINEVPVYFSKASHLSRYSFEVSDRRVKVRLRTARHNITITGLEPIKNRHMIFSINARKAKQLTNNITVEMAPDTLSRQECEYLSKYMFTISNNFKGNLAWLDDGDKPYLLNGYGNEGSNQILVGPINLSGNTRFNLYNIFTSTFKNGGSNYVHYLAPNFIRQTSINPGPYPFQKDLSNRSNDYIPLMEKVFEKSELDRIYQQLLDYRANGSAYHYSMGKGKNRLEVEANVDDSGRFPLVKYIIVYSYKNPESPAIYPGSTRSISTNCLGDCRLVLLLPDNKYFAVEHLNIRPSGRNFVRTGTVVPRPIENDSLLKSWYDNLELANRKSLESQYNESWTQTKALRSAPYLDAEFTEETSGTVLDEMNMPMAGVRVAVTGTDHETVTGLDGKYKLKTPKGANLEFLYIGYESKQVLITASEINQQMKPLEQNAGMLDEVVVTGYAAQKKASLTGSVTTIRSDELSGQVAGISASESEPQIMIRGSGSISAQATPLIIVDGVPYEGNVDDLNAADISQMNVLKDAAATALYGSRGSNGVIIITTRKQSGLAASADNEEVNLMQMPTTIRKNFKDVAFWQPMLKTDKAGKTRFSVTMPDDISAWDGQFIAMGKEKKSGYQKFKIKSIKILAASLAVPRFAIQGDSINIIGKVSNYTGLETNVLRKINVNGTDLSPISFSVKNYMADTIPIRIEKPDTFQVSYAIVQATGYSDGEERKIPVFPQGTKETKGVFYALEGDTSIVYTPDKEGTEVVFRAEGSPLPEMRKEINYIRNYEYLCNEQLASKLKALLSDKKITRYLNGTFYGENDIETILKKIKSNSLARGGWGWWPGAPVQYWISNHVIEALLQAREAGYKVEIQDQVSIDEIMMRYDDLSIQDRLYALRTLIALGAAPDYQVMVAKLEKAIEGEKERLKKERIQYFEERCFNRYAFEIIQIKQKVGIPTDVSPVLKSMRKTMFGGSYWGESSRNLFYNSTQETLLAYKILRADTLGEHKNELRNIRNYFFEQRKTGNWRNIYESSSILETILPDLFENAPHGLQASEIVYSGEKESTVSEFPFEAKSSPNQTLTIKKTGTLPVYITAYQQMWNKEPERVEKEFIVDSYFEGKGEPQTYLQAGEPVKLKVEVNVTAFAEYVMIEIPIPAGCSYENEVRQRYGGVETYREQFKNKTTIFCTRMNEGKYTFEVNLIPRFTGSYHLNPAKAELMYFPVFYGREEMKTVEIK